MRTVAVLNLKGGSAKTTTVVSLAAALAARKRRVLVVDGDAQANASSTLLDGIPAPPPTLGHVLLDQAGAEEAIRPTRLERVDVLPADAQLADVALLMADQLGREGRLRAALRTIDGRYDVVLIDGPPQLSLVSINILVAADEVVTPVDPGLYSVAGLARLRQVIDDVRRHLDRDALKISALVVTRARPDRVTRDLERQLRELFPGLVARAVIPHSVRVEEAHARHRTIVEWAPTSAPAVAYEALCKELFHGQPRTAQHQRRVDPAGGGRIAG